MKESKNSVTPIFSMVELYTSIAKPLEKTEVLYLSNKKSTSAQEQIVEAIYTHSKINTGKAYKKVI